MNNALIYQYKMTAKNAFRQFLKKPLKLIGTALAVGYFVFLPFMFKSMIVNENFDSPAWFVVVISALTIYISMPSTLSYFSRKGVVFRKQDIHFTLATPISPKQALLFALLKTAYLTFAMQIALIIAAIFVFNVPVLNALIMGVGDLVFSNSLSYSLALIMYASETLSLSQKKWIKWGVYGILAGVSLFIGFYILQNGASTQTIHNLVSHPVILLIPIFGWQLGWINLVILGPTMVSILSSILYLISAVGLTWIAYTMPCKGDYYEDALSFSQKQALLEDKQKKGDVSLSEALGKSKKVHAGKGHLSGQGAQVIFYKQIIERQRSSRLFFRFGDYMYLIAGIGVAVAQLFFNLELPPEMFFATICGITMYLVAFFSPAPTWKDEFGQAALYIMPDSISKKLFYATLLDHLISCARAIMLTLPAGIAIGATFMDMVLTIIAQVLVRAMIVYLSVIAREYLGSKLGATISQFVNMVVVFIALIVPTIGITMSIFTSSLIGFLILSGYSAVLSFVFIKLAERILTNIESLRS
ncbi:hypothetical protein AOC36_02615 [Erysipelothrix larvae]|uniref:ABC exporter n=1 Tax=Erysipelothrix larvae TaxID=1514105 RepID=A0A0X8GYV1_9FIRM|nr:putative ABC exporter domain-containing protein [Erysipelothrix larvae]AMC92915.1 hypothetical protein AOC36_02615 [Erysipelothrix larvae]